MLVLSVRASKWAMADTASGTMTATSLLPKIVWQNVSKPFKIRHGPKVLRRN